MTRKANARSLGNENTHKMRKEKPAQKECKRYAKKMLK